MQSEEPEMIQAIGILCPDISLETPILGNKLTHTVPQTVVWHYATSAFS